MKKVIALGGSNSKSSINRQLATYAAKRLNNVEVEVLDLNDFELPIYSIDLENESGFPDEALRLNTVFESADAFVISLAEHNGSYAVAFKNAVDWLSRIERNIWREKPMLLMATSPGARGGRGVLAHALDAYPRAGAKIFASFSLPEFHKHFEDNQLMNPQLHDELEGKIRELQETLDQNSLS
ncbi:MAG: NAD(P)H-dependent oxidoreductase [Polyangiaceae bacterium]|nr:NAD(P)H-dependent oxidoreductase [Polyangiaceae bacterium]